MFVNGDKPIIVLVKTNVMNSVHTNEDVKGISDVLKFVELLNLQWTYLYIYSNVNRKEGQYNHISKTVEPGTFNIQFAVFHKLC